MANVGSFLAGNARRQLGFSGDAGSGGIVGFTAPDGPPAPIGPVGPEGPLAPPDSASEWAQGRALLAQIQAGQQAPTDNVDLSGASLPPDVQQSLTPEPTQLVSTILDPTGGRLGPAGSALLSPYSLLLPGAIEAQGAARVVGGIGAGLAASAGANAVLPEDTDPLLRQGIDIGAGVLGGGVGGEVANAAGDYLPGVLDALTRPGAVRLQPGEATPRAELLPLGAGGVLDRTAASRAARAAAGESVPPLDMTDRPSVIEAAKQAALDEVKASGMVSPETTSALMGELTPEEFTGIGKAIQDQVLTVQNADKFAVAQRMKLEADLAAGRVPGQPGIPTTRAIPAEALPDSSQSIASVPESVTPPAVSEQVTPPSGEFWNGIGPQNPATVEQPQLIPPEAAPAGAPIQPSAGMAGAPATLGLPLEDTNGLPIQTTPGELPSGVRRGYPGTPEHPTPGPAPQSAGMAGAPSSPGLPLEDTNGLPVQENPGALPTGVRAGYAEAAARAPDLNQTDLTANRGSEQPPLVPPEPMPLSAKAQAAARSTASRILSAPIDVLNGSARGIQFAFDFVSPVRLLHTAGLPDLKLYYNMWRKVGEIHAGPAMDAAVQRQWDTTFAKVITDPATGKTYTLGELVPPSRAFAPQSEGGAGLAGTHNDPLTGTPNATGRANYGLIGKIPGSPRLQILPTFQKIWGPEMLAEHIQNAFNAGDLSPADLQGKPGVMADLGRSVNLLEGHSSISSKNLGPASVILNTPNWLFSQFELVGRAFEKGTITGQAARGAIARAAALGTSATYTANIAQGVKPNDPRIYKNGVPMLVITKPVSDAIAQATGGKVKFIPNSQVDMYGTLGEDLQHVLGVGGAAVSGAKTGGVAGAAGAAGKEGMFWTQGQASALTRLGTLAAQNLVGNKDTFGQPITASSYAQPFLPIPFQTNKNASGTEIGAQSGLHIHQPSVSAQVKAGGFADMAPADQFKAVPSEAWNELQSELSGNKLGAAIAPYSSMFDWYQAAHDSYQKMYEKGGLSAAEAGRRADTTMQQSPAYKAYINARTRIMNGWVTANPILAAKTDDAQADLPAGTRTFKPTKVQRTVIARTEAAQNATAANP